MQLNNIHMQNGLSEIYLRFFIAHD